MAARQEIRFSALAEYIADNDETSRAFGRRSNIDKMTLYRLLTGKMKRFDAGLIQRIADATNGKVGHLEFAAYLAELSAPRRKSGKKAA